MRLKIASRQSELARIQAREVGEALRRAHSNLEIQYQFRESLGDKNLNDPLWKMPEKGVFTEDFRQDLLSGAADLVVHSWKDLPVETAPGTEIAATLPRADMRDVLLVRRDRWEAVVAGRTLTVFSSSPRRAYNLEPFLLEALPGQLNKINFEPVRGNVPTRVRKLFEGSVDGLIVAKAALDRLLGAGDEEVQATARRLRDWLGSCFVMILPLRQNPTAAAQGALALEIASARKDIRDLLGAIHCRDTEKNVLKERRILQGFGGGCHQKVGASVLTRPYGEITFVRALADSGEIVDREDFRSASSDSVLPAASSAENIFPAETGVISWFKREFLPLSALPAGPLWITKAEALPEGLKPQQGAPVWVSGWETWKKLARRGVWVTGSAESLGEDEDPRLEALFGPLLWTQLSHQDAASLKSASGSSMKILPTYKLIPQNPDLRLEGKTHFFWSSGSSFLRALELFPRIKEAHHSCGPGNTHDILRKTLGPAAPLHIFLNYESWKKKVTR